MKEQIFEHVQMLKEVFEGQCYLMYTYSVADFFSRQLGSIHCSFRASNFNRIYEIIYVVVC
jgi:hypothetical protein